MVKLLWLLNTVDCGISSKEEIPRADFLQSWRAIIVLHSVSCMKQLVHSYMFVKTDFDARSLI